MDRQLAERMIGAAVLLGALVLVVPVILDGDGGPESAGVLPEAPAIDLQTRTIQIDGDARTPPVPLAGPPVVANPIPAAPVEPATAAADALIPAEPAVAAGAEASPPPATVIEPSPPTPAVAAGDWFVQLGSFARRDNADRLAAAVGGKGFAADVSATPGRQAAGKPPLFRVRAGPVGSRTAAEALGRELAAAGFPGTVARR
jgi:DedD protein